MTIEKDDIDVDVMAGFAIVNGGETIDFSLHKEEILTKNKACQEMDDKMNIAIDIDDTLTNSFDYFQLNKVLWLFFLIARLIETFRRIFAEDLIGNQSLK